MKRLTVLRHAKSSWDNSDLSDFDRPLNGRGWKAARRVGREFKDRQFQFDLALASPAARVRETIDGLQETFTFEAPIRFDERLYLASEDMLLTIVRELRDEAVRPLFIGHNPGLQELLLRLIVETAPRLSEIREKFPTAAVATVELPVMVWSEVEPGSGTLVELILPRDLD